jgi:hypothetical protein
MFVFYDIDDLLMLHALRLLPSINVPILVAEGKLQFHTYTTNAKIRDLSNSGLVTLIPLDDLGYEFVAMNRKKYSAAGCPLLEVLYMCHSQNAVLIVEENESFIRTLANVFQVEMITLDEFNTATINNKEYFEFINEMKKDKQRLNL